MTCMIPCVSVTLLAQKKNVHVLVLDDRTTLFWTLSKEVITSNAPLLGLLWHLLNFELAVVPVATVTQNSLLSSSNDSKGHFHWGHWNVTYRRNTPPPPHSHSSHTTTTIPLRTKRTKICFTNALTMQRVKCMLPFCCVTQCKTFCKGISMYGCGSCSPVFAFFVSLWKEVNDLSKDNIQYQYDVYSRSSQVLIL